jgi:sporulation protein YlmC with PRC-barrel domain
MSPDRDDGRPAGAPRQLWAVLELLDHQIVARDGRLAGNVDDLTVEVPDGDGDLPVVTAIVSGVGALARQIGGDAGRWLAAVEARLATSDADAEIPFSVVHRIDWEVTIGVPRDELPSNRAERWARDVIVARIPGASHASE